MVCVIQSKLVYVQVLSALNVNICDEPQVVFKVSVTCIRLSVVVTNMDANCQLPSEKSDEIVVSFCFLQELLTRLISSKPNTIINGTLFFIQYIATKVKIPGYCG